MDDRFDSIEEAFYAVRDAIERGDLELAKEVNEQGLHTLLEFR